MLYILNISLCGLKVIFLSTRSAKRKRKAPNQKDTHERQAKKSSGRRARREESSASSSTTTICSSCKGEEHKTARSKMCKNYQKTQDEVFQEVLGTKYDRYTRKIKLDTILKEDYKTKFKDRVIKLNEYLREVVIKAQLFVNYCLVDQKEYYYHKCIYKQSFWYSVCQLIMRMPVTNKDNISSSFVMAFSEFSEMYPTIFCLLKERKSLAIAIL
ncbi:hypothetical protein EDC94DRAFT_243378 [Helicostylum pulchrum]|nr:hypothetical protein EDC94DRAFT_243378 [Helicostylum pulchrum]